MTITELERESIIERNLNKYELSRAECLVVRQLLKGITNKEIADELFVTEKTVKYHLTSIFRKTATKSRLQLISIVRDTISPLPSDIELPRQNSGLPIYPNSQRITALKQDLGHIKDTVIAIANRIERIEKALEPT